MWRHFAYHKVTMLYRTVQRISHEYTQRRRYWHTSVLWYRLLLLFYYSYLYIIIVIITIIIIVVVVVVIIIVTDRVKLDWEYLLLHTCRLLSLLVCCTSIAFYTYQLHTCRNLPTIPGSPWQLFLCGWLRPESRARHESECVMWWGLCRHVRCDFLHVWVFAAHLATNHSKMWTWVGRLTEIRKWLLFFCSIFMFWVVVVVVLFCFCCCCCCFNFNFFCFLLLLFLFQFLFCLVSFQLFITIYKRKNIYVEHSSM